ncbi:outer membrane-stress sensor serine endopeptidase DegS [Paraferrimonas sedimenticola]|uniref:Outer membrane-stress sensor serine endopeptidase DegS n=1 Tax=Paraferrimonas sedimenticola TaxID=375674 RepID=A0AA37VUP6_9GAMM|nr:outer membrane-stress sensor serine endopeptidase DegS [Paraferrimonas sedimenticola]GLP95816.1 outer membrane-stress sensor serine endopeptidase DegS [Paraferrimonas sedimenticola]
MNLKGLFIYLGKAVLLGLTMAAVVLLLLPMLNQSKIPSPFSWGQPSAELSFASAVRNAAPAVVNIYSLRQTRALSRPTLQGLGSGVIMSERGYILTNYHVVSKADQILVALQDGRQFVPKVIGTDPLTDLAVLSIEGEDLPVVPYRLDTNPQVGDVVLAIGNPYNLGQTITQGIISATGRVGMSVTGQQDFLQTDAAINAGNSGGALIDTRGFLVGINTAAFQLMAEGGGHGINFAIPLKLAHEIMVKLVEHGRVIRGEIGIQGMPIDPRWRQMLNLPNLQGIQVSAVEPGSPAEKAGIRPDDIITGYADKPVTNAPALKDYIAESAPGSELELTINRAGKLYTVNVIIAELK